MAKKMMAMLLAMAMFCAFTGMGTSALTLEEEGRALLEETLAVFDGKNYTLTCVGETYIREGDRIGIEDHQWASSSLLKRLFGEVERELATPERNIIMFPERRCYFDTTLLMRLTGKAPISAFEFIGNHFGSATMLESMPVGVTQDDTYLVVTLGAPNTDGPVIRTITLTDN